MMESQKSNVIKKIMKILILSCNFDFLLLIFELIKDLDYKIINPLI